MFTVTRRPTACTRPRIARLSCARLDACLGVCAAGDAEGYAAVALVSAKIEKSTGMRKLILLSISLIVSSLAGIACSPAKNQSPVLAQRGAPLPTPSPEPSPSTTPHSPIRSVDFENFTYHEIDSRRTFTLVEGREPTEDDPRGFVDVVYGDVTDDGKEEAMVVQSQSVRGTAIPFYVYIYTMERDGVRPIWSFYAGERGDGGLRQISAVNGELFIELYGRDRVVNGGTSVEEDNVGVCCPKFYTRSRYEWRGSRFRLKGKEGALPLQGGAGYLPLRDP